MINQKAFGFNFSNSFNSSKKLLTPPKKNMQHTLLIILGPTGVGKTELSLRIAERLGSPILSADSRQLYKDLPIGTAAPTPEQLARVKHYMVGTLDLGDYYSASQFEEDVLLLLNRLFPVHPAAYGLEGRTAGEDFPEKEHIRSL